MINKDNAEFPGTLTIGEFTLDVEEIVRPGKWVQAANEFRGVAGTGWLRLEREGSPVRRLDPGLRPGVPRVKHSVEVVSRVVNAQTEVGLVEAQRIQPGAQVGQTLTVDVAVRPPELQEIVGHAQGVLGWLEVASPGGQVLVDFEKASVRLDEPGAAVGRIVKGDAIYPAKRIPPAVIELEVEGFTLVISSMRLNPRAASGSVTVRLPASIASPDTCEPAMLDLGVIALTPTCALYVDSPGEDYGPWLLGDTGIEVMGTGYVLDLSMTTSPLGRPAGWRGLMLSSGRASGENLVPDPCNTGYLRGHYGFSAAVIVQDGFAGTLTLEEACRFGALNPRADVLTLQSGWLEVDHCEIVGGEFGPGEIELSTNAVCDTAPGTQVAVQIVTLSVQPNLDLAGVVDRGGRPMSWGELTHAGEEVIAWTGQFEEGYLYLPAGPVPSYCPESGGAFAGPTLSSAVDASLTELAVKQVSGVTFARFPLAYAHSPDRPGGVRNPFKLTSLLGWLRVGSLGVDGELSTYKQLSGEKLGEPARTGYVGVDPFQAELFANDRLNRVAQFVTSAVFGSDFSGRLNIPTPCDIAGLGFDHLQITSTGHLVGGDVTLPPAGVPLGYWKLQLVPTGAPAAAGVMSARTGRIVFMAAGVAELRHFANPFSLTWGEMLASGNLGELYLDFNNYGQRFDGLPFNPQRFLLSEYVAGTVDPYLGTCGAIHFPFFGPAYVNIRDALDANPAQPYLGRNVTVPKAGISAGCRDTDLQLLGAWKDIAANDLALFDCPDAQVDYNTASQDGFVGTGTAEIAFFHSDGLHIDIDIFGGAIDIRLSTMDSHDIDLGLYARVSGVGDLSGCARIEGPLLTRMSFYGILEESASHGAILAPKAGYAVELGINVTPSSLDLYASGDMLMSVASVDLELSASVHLLLDLAMLSAEGELVGRIDCDTAINGLAGEGQVTWHVGPGMQYLQGRMRVSVCSWISGGLEGGFFVGYQVPQALAWVLQPTDPHFGVSPMVLPPLLTGVFGYGQLSFSVNLFVLGGGVNLYAGMGAFTVAPPGLPSAFPGVAGLPYVIGACGIYLHGEVLGGVASACAWADLTLRGPLPVFFEGTVGVRACVAFVLCASAQLTAGLNSGGFYLH